MASSKLIPLSSFPPRTPLPSRKAPFPQVHLNPFVNLSALRLKNSQLMIPVLQPKPSPITTIKEEEEEEERESMDHYQRFEISDSLAVACPSIILSNIFFFNSAYNIQVIVGDNEPEDKLINRFRREVLRAGVLQECKRRRFFECTQEKRKRKAREAAKKNRKRPPQPKVLRRDKAEISKKVEDSDNDNWEFLDLDLPYC